MKRVQRLLPMFIVAKAAMAEGATLPVDHRMFDELLHRYVTPAGVSYQDWSQHPEDIQKLRRYLSGLQSATPSQMGAEPALAYWINLYNAATLNLVLEKYPIKSIKDIGAPSSSPWEKTVATVEGRPLSLSQIENDVIRPKFHAARSHFALNCAARGCPPIRPEAYVGERLRSQLEDQTKRFLGDRKTNFVDATGTIWLSKIFEWYAADFEAASGSVWAFVAPYLEGSPAGARSASKSPLRYTEYDWTLNEATNKPPKD